MDENHEREDATTRKRTNDCVPAIARTMKNRYESPELTELGEIADMTGDISVDVILY